MQIKRYTVLDPKGLTWEGVKVGQGGTIDSNAGDGRITAALHFKQIRDIGVVADLGVSPAQAVPVIGAPSREPGMSAPLVDHQAVNPAAVPPTPVRQEVALASNPDGSSTATVKTEPGALAPGASLAPAARVVEHNVVPRGQKTFNERVIITCD